MITVILIYMSIIGLDKILIHNCHGIETVEANVCKYLVNDSELVVMIFALKIYIIFFLCFYYFKIQEY